MRTQLENLIIRFYYSGRNNPFRINHNHKRFSENPRLKVQEPIAIRVRSKQIELDSNK